MLKVLLKKNSKSVRDLTKLPDLAVLMAFGLTKNLTLSAEVRAQLMMLFLAA
jgi:hypothetical protein